MRPTNNANFDQAAFERGLQEWAQEPAGPYEKRNEAMQRILQCKKSRSKKLSLLGLDLTSLPVEIGELTWLQNLDLLGNKLPSLTVEIGNLRALQKLHLGDNKLTSLPEEIGNLTELQELILPYNRLASLPEAIGNLTKLKELSLPYNRLASLPEEIGNLRALQELSLNGNQLTSLPAGIGNLRALEVLYLESNQITSLPAGFGNLTNLRNLRLNGNQITSLPEEIGNLRALERLTLGSNRLSSLTAEIGNLTKLKELSLYNNQLTSLPEEIGNLTGLKELSLFKNQLTTVPDSLFNNHERIVMLRLFLENNRITYEEGQRLGLLALNSNVQLEFSIYEPSVAGAGAGVTTGAGPSISEQIIDRTPEEERENVTAFFQNRKLSIFHRFIFECSRTAAWKESREATLSALTSLICDIVNKEALKTQCLAIAETAFGTCGDRVGLAYTQMLLAQENEIIAVAAMDLQKLKERARREVVTIFLNQKAEERINEIKARAGWFDEIETYLAYLQALPKLNVNLPKAGILYKLCSNVSDKDLAYAVLEFNSNDLDSMIAEHIYEDPELSKHPVIKGIITEVGDLPEFDSIPLEHEESAEYEARVKGLRANVKQVVVEKIKAKFAITITVTNDNSASGASSSSSSAAVDTQAQATTSTAENSRPSSTTATNQTLISRPFPTHPNEAARPNYL